MKIKPSKKLETLMREVRARTEPRAAAALFGAARKLPAVRLKKLLAPVDFSMFSMAGVRYAVSLADKLGAALALVHVVEPAPLFGGEESLLLARRRLAKSWNWPRDTSPGSLTGSRRRGCL